MNQKELRVRWDRCLIFQVVFLKKSPFFVVFLPDKFLRWIKSRQAKDQWLRMVLSCLKFLKVHVLSPDLGHVLQTKLTLKLLIFELLYCSKWIAFCDSDCRLNAILLQNGGWFSARLLVFDMVLRSSLHWVVTHYWWAHVLDAFVDLLGTIPVMCLYLDWRTHSFIILRGVVSVESLLYRRCITHATIFRPIVVNYLRRVLYLNLFAFNSSRWLLILQ